MYLVLALSLSLAGVDLQRSAANAALLRDFYAAFLKGDAQGAARLVTADFILHVPGKGIHAGEYRGPEGVQKALATVLACNGGTLDVRVPVLSVNGDDAFTREWIRINRNDEPGWKDWDLAVSRHYRMKAGRISEIWVLPEDQRLYDDYWSAPCKPGTGAAATSATRPRLEVEGATSPENLRLITTACDRFLQGDQDGLQQLIAPGVIVTIAGRGVLSGTYEGWNGFLKFRERLMGLVGSRYQLEVVTAAASERDAWIKESIRMNRPSDPHLDSIDVVIHFSIEDDRITRIDEFPLDTYAWERFSALRAKDSAPVR